MQVLHMLIPGEILYRLLRYSSLSFSHAGLCWGCVAYYYHSELQNDLEVTQQGVDLPQVSCAIH